MDNFFKGLAIGFSIAAPVGPVGLLCIRRSITEGRLAGFCAGIGAATADAVYGLIAVGGLTAVTSTLTEYRAPIQLIGSLFLLVLGLKILLGKTPLPTLPNKRAMAAENVRPGRQLLAASTSTFLLTLSNPATILSFVGIFAGMRLNTNGSIGAGLVVAGVFTGSSAWWLILSTGSHWLAKRMPPHRLRWINWAAGAFLTGSALWQVGQLASAVAT